MITPDEAANAIDKTIESFARKDLIGVILVSKEVANGLYFYHNLIAGVKFRKAESGQEFEWKGIKCKVV